MHTALIRALRRQGVDCLTAKEAGMRGRSDEEHLRFATTRGRVVYSINTGDFCRLDATWRTSGQEHAGIIVLTDQRTPVGVQLRALLALMARFTEDEMVGRLEFLLNHVP